MLPEQPLFEERPSTRRCDASQTLRAWCVQEAIRRGGTHGEELAAALLGEMQMPMPFQGCDEGGQKRHEPLATDTVSRVPGQQEGIKAGLDTAFLSIIQSPSSESKLRRKDVL